MWRGEALHAASRQFKPALWHALERLGSAATLSATSRAIRAARAEPSEAARRRSSAATAVREPLDLALGAPLVRPLLVRHASPIIASMGGAAGRLRKRIVVTAAEVEIERIAILVADRALADAHEPRLPSRTPTTSGRVARASGKQPATRRFVAGAPTPPLDSCGSIAGHVDGSASRGMWYATTNTGYVVLCSREVPFYAPAMGEETC